MPLIGALEPVAAVQAQAHSLLEAPRLGADGAIVYSDVIAGGLWRCGADGSLGQLLSKRRGIGGIVPHADGGWVISGSSLLHIAPDGSQRELLREQGACGYNDLFTTPDGAVLAGELRYRPLAGEPARNGRLLALEPDGGVRVLSQEVVWPNGIGLAPDGRTIYVSDYARGCVLAVAADGSRTRELLRVPAGSADGLALDEQGAIWVALGDAGALGRFHADGRLDELLELPVAFVSSVSFGGPDRRDVLISTADNELEPELGGTLLRARSELPGLPVAPARV